MWLTELPLFACYANRRTWSFPRCNPEKTELKFYSAKGKWWSHKKALRSCKCASEVYGDDQEMHSCFPVDVWHLGFTSLNVTHYPCLPSRVVRMLPAEGTLTLNKREKSLIWTSSKSIAYATSPELRHRLISYICYMYETSWHSIFSFFFCLCANVKGWTCGVYSSCLWAKVDLQSLKAACSKKEHHHPHLRLWTLEMPN